MIIIGIVLSVFGIGFFCWLLFTLAVYALPFFAAMTAGFAAYHSGSGVVASFSVGGIVAAGTLAIGQIAFASARNVTIRAIIALLFAAPAAIAGYQVTLGLTQIGISSQGLREVFAVFGAIVVGCTAWARLTLAARPLTGRALNSLA